jgi:aspartyl-tRNA(Asn)/glutamyl-tRNA(Gln) amidotransferase subunit A
MDDTLAFASVTELAALLRRRELSPVELTQLFLERIDAHDERLNAYIAITPERAIAAARAAETAIAGDHYLGPLHGIPIALKDLIDVAGLPTTGGSTLLSDNIPDTDATVARRMAAAGAALLGKTHMVEFAFGGVGINHHYGTPWNPWDPDDHRIPGGSSSGSGVAVAAGLAPIALGSDTGGSVRIPSSFCGLVGLKPTYGRISNAGVLPLDRNLDSVGPLARTVEDAALAFQLLAGPDPADPQTWNQPPLQATDDLDEEIAGLRVCFPREFFWEEVDEEVEAAVRASAQTFADLHAHVDEISLEILDDLADLRAGVNLTAVETYLHYRDYLENYPDRFDPIVVPRMMAGKEIKAVDFLRQQIAWADLRRRALRALESVDFLITPTTPFAAPLVDDAEANYAQVNNLCLRNTSAVNLLGLCAISLPCGLTREGLPIGLQLIGRPFDEARLLRLAYAYEQATGCTQQNPDMEAFL